MSRPASDRPQLPTRRGFVVAAVAAGAALVALLVRPGPAMAHAARIRATGKHPTPRAGITSAKMPTAVALAATRELIPLFDSVRAIPSVVDGIRCNCGCADDPDVYSLLSCYEGETAMALHCVICQGEGRLAVRLHKEGKSLDAIRIAIDAKFG